MDTLLQDLRYALRGLAASPGFAAVATLTLALGIGANTAIFSLVEALMLRPLPFAEPDRLVAVWQTQPGNDERPVAPANFLDWRVEARSFDGLAAYDLLTKNLAGTDEPVRVEAASVSAGFFGVLGVPPAHGGLFAPAEPGSGARQAVLGDALWRERFGADPGVVGRVVRIDREPFEILGVMPAGFAFPEEADLWIRAPHEVPELPMPFPGDIRQLRDARYFQVVGRLAPGVSLAGARQEMAEITRRLEREYPEENAETGAHLVPLERQLAARARPLLLLLCGAVGFVLLIACANVGNLLLARGARRSGEIAVRAALGASRGRLVRQLLTESLVISLAGAGLGLLLAGVAGRLLAAAVPGMPRSLEVGLTAPVLGFTLAVAGATAVLFGLAPALRASRVRFTGALAGAGSRSAGPGRDRLRGVLVAGQVAVAMVLVTGAGLMVRSLWQLERADLGFDPERVLTFEVSLPGAQAMTHEERWAFYSQVVERVEALPGVEAAGAGLLLPLAGKSWSASLRVDGRPFLPEEAPDVCWRLATPGWFEALGLRLVRGRLFTEADRAGTPPVALVNETLARTVWPGEDPIGRRIGTGLDGEGAPVTIVGVVADVPQESVAAEVAPELYRPAAQETRHGGDLLVIAAATAGDPMAAAGAATAAVRAVSRDATVSELRPMAAVGRDSIARQRLVGRALAAFAGLALLLAGVGLYGVVSCLVDERTRELGVRAALGARRGDLLALVLGRSFALVGAGAAAGLAGALALARTLEGLLYGVAPNDPATLAIVLAALTAAAAIASWIPASRAASVDPAIVLRGE